MNATQDDRRYLIQQVKTGPDPTPVFARVMRSKEGVFEGVSFIRNRDKASLLTKTEADEAVAWARSKKSNAGQYTTTIVEAGQAR